MIKIFLLSLLASPYLAAEEYQTFIDFSYASKKISEENLKLGYKALSDDTSKTLCLLLMNEMNTNMDEIQRIYWKSETKTLYPE